MAKYVAILQNKRRGTLTTELLQKHVEYLKDLHRNGFLFLCGPFKDNDGAMQILEEVSYEAAERLLMKDPFIKYKYYTNYVLYELMEANDSNNYLMENPQTKANMHKDISGRAIHFLLI